MAWLSFSFQLLLVGSLCIVTGCQSTASRVDKIAAEHGFSQHEVIGKGFRHRVYANSHRDSNRPLHIYLEGDGSPWWNRNTVAVDPTPRIPLMLKLMAQDSSPAVYLGRPCYHGFSSDDGCSPLLWTHRRYSPEVINTIQSALNKVLKSRKHQRVVLIGYSGGGAVAMLLAGIQPDVEAVVTLAGLMDIEAWAKHHQYSPLRGSLNPLDQVVLDSSVLQKHYIGENDKVVPAHVMIPAHVQLKTGGVTLLPGIDHACCWESVWPGLLKQLP